MTKSKTVPVKARAALSRFERARANLEAFEKANKRLVEDLDLLREAHNSALREVKAVYKDNHEHMASKFGNFSVRGKTIIDGRKLVKLMGAENADPYVTLVYKVDKRVYDQGIKSGDITSEIAAEVESLGPMSIYGPREL